MVQRIGIVLIAVAIICGAVYKFREIPALGSLLLLDADAVALGYDWPPVVGDKYPDLELVDQTGQTTWQPFFASRSLMKLIIAIKALVPFSQGLLRCLSPKEQSQPNPLSGRHSRSE